MARLVLVFVVLVFLALTLGGCNTLEGAGKDIQALGEGVEDVGRAEVRWVGN